MALGLSYCHSHTERIGADNIVSGLIRLVRTTGGQALATRNGATVPRLPAGNHQGDGPTCRKVLAHNSSTRAPQPIPATGAFRRAPTLEHFTRQGKVCRCNVWRTLCATKNNKGWHTVVQLTRIQTLSAFLGHAMYSQSQLAFLLVVSFALRSHTVRPVLYIGPQPA